MRSEWVCEALKISPLFFGRLFLNDFRVRLPAIPHNLFRLFAFPATGFNYTLLPSLYKRLAKSRLLHIVAFALQVI